MQKKAKIIAMYSPIPQTGQTTLATLAGLDLAQQGKYVVIIELSRTTGFSTYLNKNLGEYKRDLKSCLINPSDFRENLVKSQHNSKLFYVSQNVFSTVADLTSYNPANIDEVVAEATKLFDYVILDLPSNPEEVSTVQVFGRNFSHQLDHVMYSITENVLAIKRLNDFDALLSQTTKATEKVDTTLIVNKSKGRYSSFLEPHLGNLPKSRIVNIINVMNVDELPYLCNEGAITQLGKTAEAKEFFSNINLITQVMLEGITGIGMKKIRDTDTKQKLKGAKLVSNKGKKGKAKGKGPTKGEKKGKPKSSGGLLGGGKKRGKKEDLPIDDTMGEELIDYNIDLDNEYSEDFDHEDVYEEPQPIKKQKKGKKLAKQGKTKKGKKPRLRRE